MNNLCVRLQRFTLEPEVVAALTVQGAGGLDKNKMKGGHLQKVHHIIDQLLYHFVLLLEYKGIYKYIILWWYPSKNKSTA